MIECPSCAFENADNANTCEKCSAALHGFNTICGIPTLGGNSAGQVLNGQYIIVRELGSDRMGAVYQAEDAELDIPVVIRALPTILADDRRETDNLRQVAKRALNLSHPNIARLYRFQSDKPIKYMVTEYIDGGSLEEKISAKGPLSLEEMLKIFIPVAAGLDYAHDRDVLHGDIKPANIILTGDGVAKLANFGITKQIKESMARITSETSDTSLYMAPEQFGGGQWQKQSDIYSLAATIYQCLCSRPPFWRGWMEYQVLKEQPSRLDKLNDIQNAALLKALSREPEDRQGSAWELLDVLGEGLSITTTAAAKAEAEARAAMEEKLRVEAEARARLEAESAEALATTKAQAEEKIESYVAAISEAEKKLQAEIEAREKVEEKIKAEAQAKTEAEEKAKAYAKTIAESEYKLRAEAERKSVF